MRLLLLCLLVSTPAVAQVSTNDQALDALKPDKPAAAAPAAAKAKTPVRTRPASHAAHPAHPAKPAQPPKVPPAPPANPVIAPPPFVMPQHTPPKPPPVQVQADAVGTVTPIPGGSEITFGPGTFGLNQATYDAILAVGAQAKANPLLQITVTAWAPGTPDDPSTPRTLALSRALAARALLINNGLVSSRIFAVSKGYDGIGAGPPDRMDIVAAAPKQTPAGTPVTPAPAAHGPVQPVKR
jgi:outer membrane protein OmpA-like peptidoglycan-associated protein